MVAMATIQDTHTCILLSRRVIATMDGACVMTTIDAQCRYCHHHLQHQRHHGDDVCVCASSLLPTSVPSMSTPTPLLQYFVPSTRPFCCPLVDTNTTSVALTMTMTSTQIHHHGDSNTVATTYAPYTRWCWRWYDTHTMVECCGCM